MESFGYSVGDQIETKISIIRSYPVLRKTAEAMGMMAAATTLADTNPIMANQLAEVYKQHDFETARL